MLNVESQTQYFPIGKEKQDHCAVVGVAGIDDAARSTYYALFALQHRGQESSGISASDGEKVQTHKDMGLVAHVYNEADIDGLEGEISIGHNRYSTSKGSTAEHAQPVVRGEQENSFIALGHNGNLPSTQVLKDFLSEHSINTAHLNDSEMMTEAIWYYMRKGAPLENAVHDAYPLFTGAFSFIAMSGDKLVAVRDPKGIRPLSIGQLNGGYIFSSETCALDTIRARHIGDVLPGEMVVVEENNLRKYQVAEGQQNLDIFEFIYFARPDSILLGQRVNEVRRRFGMTLWEESPIQADVVIPVPDSAVPAALGFSQASGIPYDDGFIKNRYIHRTFIEPNQRLRELGVALKLNPLQEVLGGKRVVVTDDSIVRGTTLGQLVKLVRSAGAKEVHLRITSPPYLYPDFYGVDTPDQSALIAARMTLKEMCEYVNADSLEFLSYNGMIRATQLPEELFYTANFTGIYPLDIGEKAECVRRVVFSRE